MALAILLNGASSSGKTTLANALQEHLFNLPTPLPTLHLSLDQFIAAMPNDSNKLLQPGESAPGFYWQASESDTWRIRMGDFGEQVNQAYRMMVKATLDQGVSVILADVFNGLNEWKQWQPLLSNHDYLLAGIHCDLKTLQARARSRGDRVQGSAEEQTNRVHTGMPYDLNLDTSKQSQEDWLKAILNKLESKR